MDGRGRVVILDAADATAFSALMAKTIALTDSLWELYGVAEEGNARGRHQERDEDVLKAVKERLQPLR